jgi:hypothetical protein
MKAKFNRSKLGEPQESWIARIRERLEHSWAQAQRGEVYTPEEALRILDEDRRKRMNRT